MTALIERLEAAAEGSRELDLHVHLTANEQPGDPPIDTYVGYDGHEFRFAYGDQQTGVWGDHVVPHYTTSLDAKLPGENIVKTWMLGGLWNAENMDRQGRCTQAKSCATEALARRIAALKARAVG